MGGERGGTWPLHELLYYRLHMVDLLLTYENMWYIRKRGATFAEMPAPAVTGEVGLIESRGEGDVLADPPKTLTVPSPVEYEEYVGSPPRLGGGRRRCQRRVTMSMETVKSLRPE